MKRKPSPKMIAYRERQAREGDGITKDVMERMKDKCKSSNLFFPKFDHKPTEKEIQTRRNGLRKMRILKQERELSGEEDW